MQTWMYCANIIIIQALPVYVQNGCEGDYPTIEGIAIDKSDSPNLSGGCCSRAA